MNFCTTIPARHQSQLTSRNTSAVAAQVMVYIFKCRKLHVTIGTSHRIQLGSKKRLKPVGLHCVHCIHRTLNAIVHMVCILRSQWTMCRCAANVATNCMMHFSGLVQPKDCTCTMQANVAVVTTYKASNGRVKSSASRVQRVDHDLSSTQAYNTLVRAHNGLLVDLGLH